MTAALSADFVLRIQRVESLPTIPIVFRDLLDSLQKPIEDVNPDAVVNLAQQDKVITAQCLRMANSSLFGGTSTVTSMRDAIVKLGLRRVQEVLLSLSVGRVLPKERYIVDPLAFWRHSLGCALVARKFAEVIRFPEPERCYLAALLHDIGIVFNSFAFPKEFRAAVEQACHEHTALHIAEQLVNGFTHCESGAVLGQIWRLPQNCVDVIQHHHGVSEFHSAASSSLVALVSLADLFCRVDGMGYGYSETLRVDFPAEPAWHLLVKGFKHLERVDLARLTFDIGDAVSEISSLVNIIFSPAPARPS